MKRWEVKERVISLRKKGLSYNEIRAKIPLAKSTISHWCRDIELTKEQILRLNQLKAKGSYAGRLKGSKVNQKRRAIEIAQIKEAARLEAPLLLKEKFWLAGLMLYWAEGHKSGKVGISNSDPNIIEFLMEWLRRYCNVENPKFKPHLNLHSGQNEDEIKEFWSKIIKLPKERFGKSYIKKEGTGHRKNILYRGTLRVDICNKNLLYKILGWIEGIIDLFRHNKLLIKVDARIAQLVEQDALNVEVLGSIPSAGTKPILLAKIGSRKF